MSYSLYLILCNLFRSDCQATTIDGPGQRMATRVGRDRVNALNMLTMTLPGTSVVYYGDEIAMQDVDVPLESTQDYYAKKGNDVRNTLEHIPYLHPYFKIIIFFFCSWRSRATLAARRCSGRTR